MRRLSLLLLIAATAPLQGQAPPVLPGMARYQRDIGTTPQAQRYFDQGLTLVYGFNHDEAQRALEAAARIDSMSPMIQWGLALTQAPTVDRGRSPNRDRAARAALGRALAQIGRARPADAALIRAYAVRYADSTRSGPALDSAYAEAMGALFRDQPDDAEAGTLYGEALMLLARRHYWMDGAAAPGTDSLLAAFERVMRRHPDHPGANHYYIHALEMSPVPERALAAAERLQSIAPGAGHLVHMSAHVYYRLGRWADAVRANQRALAADTALFRLSPPPPAGTYPAGYHLHTLHFLWLALARENRYAEALAVADTLAARAAPSANAGLYAQSWSSAPLFVQLRFRRWDSVLSAPRPPVGQRFSSALWTYARGLALLDRGDVPGATAAADTLELMAETFPPGNVAPTAPARPLVQSAARHLRARLLAASGAREAAMRLLDQNVAAEDSLGLMEPPPWYETAREARDAVLQSVNRPSR